MFGVIFSNAQLLRRDPARAIKTLAAAAAAVCVLSLLIAYFYMERHLLLQPCPLCILDRIAVGAMALGFGALALMNPSAPAWKAWTAWGITSAALALGFVFAGRHIWLQNRPIDMAAECLSDTAAAQNLIKIIEQAFDAKADCGAIMWEFAGMTIPEQVLLLFVALALAQAALAVLLLKARRTEETADATTETRAAAL